jgi:hypothetical protein
MTMKLLVAGTPPTSGRRPRCGVCKNHAREHTPWWLQKLRFLAHAGNDSAIVGSAGIVELARLTIKSC